MKISLSLAQFGLSMALSILLSYQSIGQNDINPNPLPEPSLQDASDLLLGGSSPAWPWEICAEYNGELYCANAYTLWSEDGILDKPFIFVEGIDFLQEHSLLKNGGFGWFQFSSGLDPEYAFVKDMPILLNALREEGYDLVLVDFYDGATFIQANAAVLVELINRINVAKVDGAEPNVLAGASMGGQISRYALTYMEHNNMKHCCREWISLDSPHNGAYIPIGLQDMIKLLIDYSPDTTDVVEFRDNYLKRPAARQMLYEQTFGPSLFDQYYAEIDAMGYPKLTRNIAITDGNGSGIGLNYGDGASLLNWTCINPIFATDLPLAIQGAGIPGYINHPDNTSTEKVTACLVIPSADNIHLSFNPFKIVLEVSLKHCIKRNLSTKPRYDHMPGGTRSSMIDMADAINNALNSINLTISNAVEEQYPFFGDLNYTCTGIDTSDYIHNHCFVPTASALGMADFGYWTNYEELWNSNPEAFPFDDLWMALLENNLRHAEVKYGSDGNIQFILDQVINGQNQIGPELNNDIFNYGKRGDYLFYPIHVLNGGLLKVNRDEYTHFQMSQDGFPHKFHLDMSTSECGSLITADNSGTIEIGDPTGSHTANLTLRSMATMTIGENGTLIIYPNSKLIVEDGAELIIYPNSNLRLENGSIIVKAGGKVTIHEGVVPGAIVYAALINENSAIVFDGGELHIADNTTFEIVHGEFVSGYVEFKGVNNRDLYTGLNSAFKLTGTGPNDVILKINQYADLWSSTNGAATLFLSDCKVDLSDHGRIWTDLRFSAANTVFEDGLPDDTHDGGILQIDHTHYCSFYDCDFNHVRLRTVNCNVALNTCDFRFEQSGFICNSGSFLMHSCYFEFCHMESSSLDQLSTLTLCYFTNPDWASNYGATQRTCLTDESLVELRLDRCEFHNGREGIFKTGGQLSLKCCLFEHLNSYAVWLNSAVLNMSGSNGAGYNIFHDVNTCIQLWNANHLDLCDGYNNLSGYNECCICGTVAFKCIVGCDLTQYAEYNYWGSPQYSYPPTIQINGAYSPSMQEVEINVYTTDGPPYCNIYNENGVSSGCRVHFIDTHMSIPTGCGTGILFPRRVRSLSVDESTQHSIFHQKELQAAPVPMQLKNGTVNSDNPNLSGGTFDGIDLDSALVCAASQMEIYNALGDDNNAIQFFHEILMSPLDRSNSEIRWRMEWGRYNMKSAMENLFLTNELSPTGNDDFFEAPVALYVDVLNAMTDTVLTDSTYKSQFYLELDKGQLFRTIGNPLMAKHIYMHLDDCQLDSIEQSVLNNWRAAVDLELSLFEQYVIQDISPDSLSYEVDTTGYAIPESYTSSDYYFGLWIDSPNSVTFVNCGDHPVYKSATASTNSMILYPNPTKDLVTIEVDKPGIYHLEILDLSGRMMFKSMLNFSDNMKSNLELPTLLARGSYVIKMESDDGIYINQLIRE